MSGEIMEYQENCSFWASEKGLNFRRYPEKSGGIICMHLLHFEIQVLYATRNNVNKKKKQI